MRVSVCQTLVCKHIPAVGGPQVLQEPPNVPSDGERITYYFGGESRRVRHGSGNLPLIPKCILTQVG